MVSWGPIWCLLAFPTKVLNICNSRMSAIPNVRVHLGVIRLHPLHSPPFVKVCFTRKHTFGFMGPCTSHLIVNPMLGLWQWALNVLSKSMLKRLWWCRRSEMESWNWTICCRMSCSNGRKHARARGGKRSHVVFKVLLERKFIIDSWKASRRKGCWSTINLVAMIKATKAQFLK
jgi:hypothetical protein